MNGAKVRDIILESINEGVFTVDREWRITSFNAAAELITGVPRDEAIGRRCIDVFHASICENACVLRRTMSDGKPVVNAVAHIVNHDGQRVPIRISTALLKDDKDRIVGGVETFQDLSQVEELRKELPGALQFSGYHRPKPGHGAPLRYTPEDRREQQHRPDRRGKRHGKGTLCSGGP